MEIDNYSVRRVKIVQVSYEKQWYNDGKSMGICIYTEEKSGKPTTPYLLSGFGTYSSIKHDNER